MKIWTYDEMYRKILEDLDLEDETFIKPGEMRGYFNEALTEAQSEILLLNQDYFVAKAYIPVVQGQEDYILPYNLFSNKIRGIIYQNGSIDYEIKQFRRKNKFMDVLMEQKYGYNDWYGYFLPNDIVGSRTIRFVPMMRDTAILNPPTDIFAPIQMWYLRNCNRVPINGELCNPEFVLNSAVDFANDEIQTRSGQNVVPGNITQWKSGPFPGSTPFITGDAVQLQVVNAGGALPAGLSEKTTYYVIAGANGLIKLATTKALAFAGTAIDITDAGTGSFLIWVAATDKIVKNILIDIPEFATFIMQWVKCRCLKKEGDPRLKEEAELLVQQKKQMVDTLTQMIPDDDDKIYMDLSFYDDMA